MGRAREEKRREEKRRTEKKEDQRRERVKPEDRRCRCEKKMATSRNTVSPMICGCGGSKSRLAKTAGAELSGEMRDEKLLAVVARSTFPSQNVQNTPRLDIEMSKECTPLWREAHFQVKMYKAHQVRSTFGSSDVEKVHVVVARNIFPSQKRKKLTATEHFWTFRCRFTWPAQGIVHLRVLQHFQNRWQAWDI